MESVNNVKLAYGLGTALYKTSKEEKDEDVLHLTSLAIENGYYHLDGAERRLVPVENLCALDSGSLIDSQFTTMKKSLAMPLGLPSSRVKSSSSLPSCVGPKREMSKVNSTTH